MLGLRYDGITDHYIILKFKNFKNLNDYFKNWLNFKIYLYFLIMTNNYNASLTAELLALIEDDDFWIGKKIDAVYIPLNVDEITDEEVCYDYASVRIAKMTIE